MDHSEGLHDQCFWLYGVFVGLAVQQALATAFPHILTPPPFTQWHGSEDAARLGVFLLLIIRFYLGSAFFFKTAYTGSAAHLYKKKSYFSDFFFGLIHFLMFFALAATLDFHTPGQQKTFLYVLLVVLLYDGLWFLACRKYSTYHLMKIWTMMNIVTAVAGTFLYLLAIVGNRSPATQEKLAFLPILVMSIIDFVDLKSGNRAVAGWLFRIAIDPNNPAPNPHDKRNNSVDEESA